MVDKIVRETIREYIEKDMLLREYRNPNDSNTVKNCADMLEQLYNNIVSNGVSKNEFTVSKLADAIRDLRKIEKWFGNA